MFIVSLTYIAELSEVDRFIDEHIAYLEKYYAAGNFILSGRKMPRTGGVILAKAKNKKALDIILQEDPFAKAKLARYDIIEFLPTKAAEEFATLME